MRNENGNALKGHQILALGNALGLWAINEIVRALAFIKEIFMFRTKKMYSGFPKIISCNSVRKELFAMFIEFPGRFFYGIPYPGRRFGSFLPNFAQGYVILAFQAEIIHNSDWCIIKELSAERVKKSEQKKNDIISFILPHTNKTEINTKT